MSPLFTFLIFTTAAFLKSLCLWLVNSRLFLYNTWEKGAAWTDRENTCDELRNLCSYLFDNLYQLKSCAVTQNQFLHRPLANVGKYARQL